MDKLLTVEEVASMLKMSAWTVYKMVQTNRLPVVRVGRLLRFSTKDITEYLRHRTVKSISPEPVP